MITYINDKLKVQLICIWRQIIYIYVLFTDHRLMMYIGYILNATCPCKLYIHIYNHQMTTTNVPSEYSWITRSIQSRSSVSMIVNRRNKWFVVHKELLVPLDCGKMIETVICMPRRDKVTEICRLTHQNRITHIYDNYKHLNQCWLLDSRWLNFSDIGSKIWQFWYTEMNWQCSLQNGGHIVSTSMCEPSLTLFHIA